MTTHGPKIFENENQRQTYKHVMLPLKVLSNDGGGVPCEMDPETWWSDNKEEQADAAAVCMTCPMRQPCGEWALIGNERYGVWGGMTPAQRVTVQNKLKRQRTAANKKADNGGRHTIPNKPNRHDPGIPDGVDPTDERHGTTHFYAEAKCRCAPCRAAKAEQRKRYTENSKLVPE